MQRKSLFGKFKKNVKSIYDKTSKNKFQKRELWSKKLWNKYNSFRDIFSFKFNIKTLILSVVFFFCLRVIFVFGKFLTKVVAPIFEWSSSIIMNAVSKSLWEPMKVDEYGNINTLLIWFGWDWHAWGHLADTIILASYSTLDKTVTMISIPRDLYIYEKWRYANRINSIFAFEYSDAKWDLDIASKKLSKKVSEIFGVKIPYYALVDFKWFKTLIDSMGGIELDVPYTIHDVTYPVWERKYGTFHIDAWLQTLNWDTALKYARSRHTTSDFSRSARQQLIIKAIIHKIMNKSTLWSPSAIQNLYKQYSNMVYTNIKMWNMLWGLKFASNWIPKIFSFWLTMECMDLSYKTVQPWCLLYNWVRAHFNWMAVLLPRGASKSNPSYYEYTKYFASIVTRHGWFLKEDAKIWIYNWIDKKYARNFRYRNWFASKLSAKLRRYAFNIIDVGNSKENYKQTTLVINWQTWDYKQTIKMLKTFFDIPNIKVNKKITNLTWDSINTGNIVNPEDENKPDLEIYLGNDFIKRFGNKKFDMYAKSR